MDPLAEHPGSRFFGNMRKIKLGQLSETVGANLQPTSC